MAPLTVGGQSATPEPEQPLLVTADTTLALDNRYHPQLRDASGAPVAWGRQYVPVGQTVKVDGPEHPAKGTYQFAITPGMVTILPGAYFSIAKTGAVGIVNLTFEFAMGFGGQLADCYAPNANGEYVIMAQQGFTNLKLERPPEARVRLGLQGNKSGIKVHELPDFVMAPDGSTTNITEILGVGLRNRNAD